MHACQIQSVSIKVNEHDACLLAFTPGHFDLSKVHGYIFLQYERRMFVSIQSDQYNGFEDIFKMGETTEKIALWQGSKYLVLLIYIKKPCRLSQALGCWAANVLSIADFSHLIYNKSSGFLNGEEEGILVEYFFDYRFTH